MAIEFGHQEIPTVPENLVEGLKGYDPRLRLAFDVRRGLWKVEEQLRNSGSWSFVTYWADGKYPDYTYRHLPATIGPILAKIDQCDLVKYGSDLTGLVRDLDERGAAERARRKVELRAKMADKLRKYMRWAMDRAAIVQRRYEKGGRSRDAAIRERSDILRDLGLRGE